MYNSKDTISRNKIRLKRSHFSGKTLVYYNFLNLIDVLEKQLRYYRHLICQGVSICPLFNLFAVKKYRDLICDFLKE